MSSPARLVVREGVAHVPGIPWDGVAVTKGSGVFLGIAGMQPRLPWEATECAQRTVVASSRQDPDYTVVADGELEAAQLPALDASCCSSATTARNASTTSGSSWDPEQRRSSSSASSTGIAA